MARKNVTINLNGGDETSSNQDLEFQFYDADNSDAIITTANYAAIGSENNPGTDSANLSFNSNDAANGGDGEMVISGVDVGSATNIKVSVRDEANNESSLSAAFDTSPSGTIIWQNDFSSDISGITSYQSGVLTKVGNTLKVGWNNDYSGFTLNAARDLMTHNFSYKIDVVVNSITTSIGQGIMIKDKWAGDTVDSMAANEAPNTLSGTMIFNTGDLPVIYFRGNHASGDEFVIDSIIVYEL